MHPIETLNESFMPLPSSSLIFIHFTICITLFVLLSPSYLPYLPAYLTHSFFSPSTAHLPPLSLCLFLPLSLPSSLANKQMILCKNIHILTSARNAIIIPFISIYKQKFSTSRLCLYIHYIVSLPIGCVLVLTGLHLLNIYSYR